MGKDRHRIPDPFQIPFRVLYPARAAGQVELAECGNGHMETEAKTGTEIHSGKRVGLPAVCELACQLWQLKS